MGPPRRISSRVFPWTTATAAQAGYAVLTVHATSATRQSTPLLLRFLTASFFFPPSFSFPDAAQSFMLFLGHPDRLFVSIPTSGEPIIFPRKKKKEVLPLILVDRSFAVMWRGAVYSGVSCCSAHLRNNISVWKGHSRGCPAFTAPLCFIYVTLFSLLLDCFSLRQNQMQLVKTVLKAAFLRRDHNWGENSWILQSKKDIYCKCFAVRISAIHKSSSARGIASLNCFSFPAQNHLEQKETQWLKLIQRRIFRFCTGTNRKRLDIASRPQLQCKQEQHWSRYFWLNLKGRCFSRKKDSEHILWTLIGQNKIDWFAYRESIGKKSAITNDPIHIGIWMWIELYVLYLLLWFGRSQQKAANRGLNVLLPFEKKIKWHEIFSKLLSKTKKSDWQTTRIQVLVQKKPSR